MKPFFVLLICFGSACLYQYLFSTFMDIKWSGRMALSLMLLFTAMGHFKFKKGMAMMLPDFVPVKSLIIIATGFFEILLAIAIRIPMLQTIGAWLLIATFILFLPANVYAASRHLNYEKGTHDGPGVSYLWFRIPFQILLIGWTYYSVLQ